MSDNEVAGRGYCRHLPLSFWQADKSGSNPCESLFPELRLALAVVRSAITDIARGQKKRYAREWEPTYQKRKLDGLDAEDFLLRRLNQPDNYWGMILRECGMKPLTQERVSHLVRNPELLVLEEEVPA